MLLKGDVSGQREPLRGIFMDCSQLIGLLSSCNPPTLRAYKKYNASSNTEGHIEPWIMSTFFLFGYLFDKCMYMYISIGGKKALTQQVSRT